MPGLVDPRRWAVIEPRDLVIVRKAPGGPGSYRDPPSQREGDLRGVSGGFGGNFRIGKMLASGDLRLVALFLFWQVLHVFEILKNNVRKNRGFHWSIVFDLVPAHRING